MREHQHHCQHIHHIEIGGGGTNKKKTKKKKKKVNVSDIVFVCHKAPLRLAERPVVETVWQPTNFTPSPFKIVHARHMKIFVICIKAKQLLYLSGVLGALSQRPPFGVAITTVSDRIATSRLIYFFAYFNLSCRHLFRPETQSPASTHTHTRRLPTPPATRKGKRATTEKQNNTSIPQRRVTSNTLRFLQQRHISSPERIYKTHRHFDLLNRWP